jgi:DNA repair protein RadD
MSKVTLRIYQQRAIDQLYAWFRAGNTGNPCLVLPTGAGKSHIVAALCEDALTQWPETRVLMLTHVKELIEQNAAKLRAHWPGAPMGIYSASVGRRQLGEPITFAGIQSIRKRASDVGHVDLVIIDEAHLVSHKDEGGYRDFLRELAAINPALRVVGLTATPYRLGHGYITDKPALFDDLITPIGIDELVHHGFLAKLRSKWTECGLNTEGVHTRGGEFIESELQRAVNTRDQNERTVRETIALAGSRKSWLFFCCGVDHARDVCAVLREEGIDAECVTGDTPKKERERIIGDFKSGKLRALTNANVLTTGFDAPNIDLIAMMRPTLSPGLYVQMAGRGLRVAPGKADCLVLDFAGVVETHGPIIAVKPPSKAKKGTGEAPVKVCDACNELVHPTCRVCPSCGHEFPQPEEKPLQLRDVDIMGAPPSDVRELEVTEWEWRRHVGASSGKESLRVRYYGGLTETIDEYLTIAHDGYAGDKARRLLARIASDAGMSPGWALVDDLDEIAREMNATPPPAVVRYTQRGKFAEILKREWAADEREAVA